MRTAETVLNIIRERGEKGLPLEDVYRQLYNPDLYLRAYSRIYSNDGAMTEGTTTETIDGMSLAKIDTIINEIRCERYHWTPVRRVEIPKKNGKTRPLGIPTWSDKLLQEVMRSLLEAYYEPQFSDLSYGFRPSRGCHTALTEITRTWTGTKWFVEGDIKGCFDNIDHRILLEILRENIHDNRFIRLVENLLKAGYIEYGWKYGKTLSGSPQGGIVSPILANIYLDKLDKYVEQTLIPEYTRGDRRQKTNEYGALEQKARRRRQEGKWKEAHELEKQYQQLPSRDPNDPDYRRLKYARYADDFLLGFAGPKAEADEIKDKLKTFCKDRLNLELSEEKTLITNARTERARFLGYEVVGEAEDTRHDQRGHRTVNGNIVLRLPADVVEEKCARYMENGKPERRAELVNDEDYSIFMRYQLEFRGLVQYYLLAQNVAWLHKLEWVMRTSLLKTLANKYKASVTEMANKYLSKAETPHGPKTCLEVTVTRQGKKPLVARFGGISLTRQRKANLVDNPPIIYAPFRNELLKRLLAEECEICESTDNLEVHHIRKLADLKRKDGRPTPDWVRIMISRRRKTIVLCRSCHDDLHAGRPLKQQIKLTE